MHIHPAKDADTDTLLRQSAAVFPGVEVIPEIRRTEKGKPYIANIPGLFVSVSHSGSYWVCAVSRMRVGVDLQSHDRMRGESAADADTRLRRLSSRFFHRAERAYLSSAPYPLFYDVWSAKESYVKYTGTGIDDTFWMHSVLPEGYDGAPVWTSCGAFFERLAFEKGYSLVVCAEESPQAKLVWHD